MPTPMMLPRISAVAWGRPIVRPDSVSLSDTATMAVSGYGVSGG